MMKDDYVNTYRKQNKWIIAITIVLALLNVPGSGSVPVAIGVFFSPFLWGFLVAGLVWGVEKIASAISDTPSRSVVNSFKNHAIKLALVWGIILNFPLLSSLLEGIFIGLNSQ